MSTSIAGSLYDFCISLYKDGSQLWQIMSAAFSKHGSNFTSKMGYSNFNSALFRNLHVDTKCEILNTLVSYYEVGKPEISISKSFDVAFVRVSGPAACM